MKHFARCISLILAITMVLAIPANATETATERSSNFFTASNVYLYKTSDTTFQAWFDVTCMRTMEKVGASVIKIQRSSDNENWTTMKTYTMEDYSNLINEDSVTHSACVTYTGTRGYYYRAYIKLYAENSSGSAIWNRYTSSIYIELL